MREPLSPAPLKAIASACASSESAEWEWVCPNGPWECPWWSCWWWLGCRCPEGAGEDEESGRVVVMDGSVRCVVLWRSVDDGDVLGCAEDEDDDEDAGGLVEVDMFVDERMKG